MKTSLCTSNFPHGIMFHRFHSKDIPPTGLGSITGEQFEKILHFIGFKNILSPEEWLDKFKKKFLKKTDVCLTFDHSYIGQYAVALPILEKYKLKCFWFHYSSIFNGEIAKFEVYNFFSIRCYNHVDEFYEQFLEKCGSGFLNELVKEKFRQYTFHMKNKFPFYSDLDLKYRYMRDHVIDRDEFESLMDKMIKSSGTSLKALSKDLWFTCDELKDICQKGHMIGLHSYDHPLQISQLSQREQLEQYIKNYEHLKKVCNTNIVSMSHPQGDYNEDTLMVLRELNILVGFRSNMVAPTGKGINPNSLELARQDHTTLLKIV